MTLKQQAFSGISVEEAVRLACGKVPAGNCETVSLMEAAGRTLAYPLYAPFAMPPFRRAAMDGYAVRSAETLFASESNPAMLRVCGQQLPGALARLQGEDLPMQAVRIFTGAPVPDGYDTVVMQEAVLNGCEGEPSVIKLTRPCRKGEHVALCGEDVEDGSVVLQGGRTIGAKEMAILASFGQHQVAVRTKPRIAVVPVGDELVVPGTPRGPYQIYDSNGLMVEVRLRELGADAVRFEPVPDQPHSIEQAIRSARDKADIIITIGGISVGNHDYVAQAAEQAGGYPLFRRMLMKPGKPTSAFAYGNGLILSLSGNPSACFAGLELLAKPVVAKASGRQAFENKPVTAMLAEDVSKPCALPRYIRSTVSLSEGKLIVRPLGRERAGNIAAFAHTEALAVIPPGGRGASAGDAVEVVLLNNRLASEVHQQEDLYTCLY